MRAYSNLAVVDGMTLRIAHHDSLDDDIAARYLTVPFDESTPLGMALLSGDAVVLPSLASYETRYAHMIDDTRAAGIAATISFPIVDRSPIAAIGVAWTEPAWDPNETVSTLTTLANVAYSWGYALESSLL
jgi:hypothetical protein